MMKKFLIATGLAIASFFAQASEEEEWILAGINDAKTFAIQLQQYTGEYKTTKGGVKVRIVNGKMLDASNKDPVITLVKFYISLDDCRKGAGTVVALHMDNNYYTEFLVTLKGPKIVDSVARLICYDVLDRDKKTI